MSHKVILAHITSVCRNIMHSHTKWFYLIFGILLTVLTQISLSTRTIASRSGDSIILTQETKQLEKEAPTKSRDHAIADSYASKTPIITKAATPAATTSTPTLGDHISIGGRIIPIFYSSNTLTDSGNQAGLYGQLLYGHNSANVFGILPSLPAGTTFSIALGGNTTNYQISGSQTLEKPTVQNLMGGIVRGSIYSGGRVQKHSLILMTCAGTSYGNGDASHRTIVFADQV